MAIDWSDNIVVAQLADEPSLSDELASLLERLEVEGAETPHVVLDFSAVSYINSSNIAQLLRLTKRLEESGRQMRLAGLSDEVWSVMMVTGLDRVFRFAPDTMTALAGLQIDDAAAE